MTKIAVLLALLIAALACLLPAAPARAAGAARTFVSAAGSDSNNCTNVTTPCRHLATAYAATAANGEIYVLDPANYGSVTITGPVSIEGHGWASIAPVVNNPAITITANPGDKINIIGVVLDGTALANTTGILFNSGGTLTVRDSVIRNFGSSGINFFPSGSSTIFVANTLVSDNASLGVQIIPTSSGAATGVLDHVHIENNSSTGLIVSAPAGKTANVTVAGCVIVSNGGDGIESTAGGGTQNVVVRNATIANNAVIGLEAQGTNATILVTRSTMTGNATAWANSANGTVTSYGDNNIDGNGAANTEPPNPFTYK